MSASNLVARSKNGLLDENSTDDGSYRMINVKATLLALMFAAVGSTLANGAEQPHTSTVKYVYVQPNGDFVLIFNTSPTTCTDTHADKYFGVAIGQVGMTAEGSRKLYGLALTAYAVGAPMTITFDDSTWNCYVIRATINPM